MASFASADISNKSGSSLKTELPDNEMSTLEFPGGIAYDHEALPKLVAVHTLIKGNPGQTNAQDISVTDKDIKKTRLPELPLRNNAIPRQGSRRWIIRSKPELPFSQLTTAPKTHEEISQAQYLPSPSCYDEVSPKKSLFNLCSINSAYTAYCYEDLDKRSQDEINENESQGPLSQELPSYTSVDTASPRVMISRNVNENESQSPPSLELPSYTSVDTASPRVMISRILNENESQSPPSLELPSYTSMDTASPRVMISRNLNENESQSPPSQELPSYSSMDTSPKVMISRTLKENEIEKEAPSETDQRQSNETVEKGKEANKLAERTDISMSFKWHHYLSPLGDSQEKVFNSKKGDPTPVAELKTTRSEADRGLSVKSLEHSLQTVTTVREDENNDQEIMRVSHSTPFVPSQDSIIRSTVNKEHINKLPETAIQFCSDPNESKNSIGKASDSALAGNASLKGQVWAASKKNFAPWSINLKQETSASTKIIVQKAVPKSDKTLLSTDIKRSHRKLPKNQRTSLRSSASDKTPSVKNSDASRNGKLSLRERMLKKIKRMKDNMKRPYKETPEATRNFYSTLAKYRKLDFGVASSLSELSKNGDINQEVGEDGQVKKNELSEEPLEEVVLMETLRNDGNAHKMKFTTEQKKLHENIKSKSRMKEQHEELKNELNDTKGYSPVPFELGFVRANEDDGQDVHSIGSIPIEENEKQEEAEVRDSDDLSGEKTLQKEQENGYWSDRVNDVGTSIPERKKSLKQCLDKLRTISASYLKRPSLGTEKENGLRVNNQDPGCIAKHPRKAAPRRLFKGRCPSYSDNDSISPDHSLSDLPQGTDRTSSEVQDHLSLSNLPSNYAQGTKGEETNEPLWDFWKSGSTKEENLNIENMKDDSSTVISSHRDTIALPKHSVSESATVTCDNTTSLKTFPHPCLFTKDTLKEQMEKATWEPSWYGDDDKTPVYTQSWIGVPYTTVPQENYTIKTSLDREERIKALLAKQNQLLSKINGNFSGNSS